MTTTEEKLEKALPELAAKIESITGCRMELNYNRRKQGEEFCYTIFSEDLSNQLCGITKPIFKRINFTTWGGTNSGQQSHIWFAPKVEYTHWGGGSNGTDYIWNSLYFNIEKGEWDWENSCLIKNN